MIRLAHIPLTISARYTGATDGEGQRAIELLANGEPIDPGAAMRLLVDGGLSPLSAAHICLNAASELRARG